MNAPSCQMVTCPTCKGSGEQPIVPLILAAEGRIPARWRNRTRRCLACRGEGVVDAARVCPDCGQWIDNCLCKRSRNIVVRKSDSMEGMRMIASDSNGNGQAPAAPVDADERVKGVTWDRTNERWVVKLTRDDITYFLGAYRDKQHALGIRMEAERLPAEDFPRLRERYRQMAGHKRGRKVQQPATPPDHLLEEKPRQDNGQQNSDQVSEADSSSPDEQRLVTLIARARAADERMQRLARESVVAATAAEKAEQEAVAAWNVVAEAIAALGGRKPAHSHDLSSQG